jgi:hypothetical protein
MDTHGKMNAEFHNNVNEILARHEISFDPVNIALQVVLTKLQALQASRDESSHQHTSRSNTINDHSHRHLKFSFPKFNREDSTKWIYKAKQYLNSKILHQNNKFSWPPSI